MNEEELNRLSCPFWSLLEKVVVSCRPDCALRQKYVGADGKIFVWCGLAPVE